MAVQYVKLTYSGPDLGPLYLSDIGARYGIKGGRYGTLGQDVSIKKGDVLALVETGDVDLSSVSGRIAKYTTPVTGDKLIDGLLLAGKIQPSDITIVGGVRQIPAPLVLASATGLGDTNAPSRTEQKGAIPAGYVGAWH